MNKHWRWVLTPLYPLLALNVLVALAYAKAWCKARSWQWRSGVLTFVATRAMIGNPGGQGWSWVVGYASDEDRDSDDLRVHENVHVWQELMFALLGLVAGVIAIAAGYAWLGVLAMFLGGPLFTLCYGLGFVAGFFRTGEFWLAYRANPFEVHAYQVQDEYLNGGRPDAWK